MVILVSDTSILIDLEKGGLLESIFSCGMTYVVPDLLYEKELADQNGSYLKSLGLGVVSLTSEEMVAAQSVWTNRPTLSLPDCCALICAKRDNHILLTGDRVLRNEARSQTRTVYGLLWLLDRVAASSAVPIQVLHEGLTRIAADPTCRLPTEEVRMRLEAWDPAKFTHSRN